ncbi:MAG: tryptophan 7-halogenase [Phycisphaeraceae bacterium]|nr:tryptophan 7-halogenase [Phycisphaeraceae bacterium]
MTNQSEPAYDVAIIGGGPGGSTTGMLLKKYAPGLRVLIVEREQFPREHIGESLLPPVSRVLDEAGVWDKVESAGFPIKFGATYTWGKTTEPWTFGFIPVEEIPKDYVRPGKYEGWRTRVALQVERSEYDKVLLDHAASVGCEVRERTRVAQVEREGDTVTGLVLGDGTRVTARYYVDASGNAAVLRRAMGVKVEVPTLLKNVAFWDYWSAEGMNGPIWEGGATRIHIRSTAYGWIWYIALGMDRTSVGLVCNADYYKASGKRPEELYREAIASDPLVLKLIGEGRARGQVESTTDWSFIADRAYGANWFLCGESLGFADPILSAGLALTHTCARQLAYTIIELDRGEHDRAWLLGQYDTIQRKRVGQHIKFADYWYSGNGLFSAIQENCTKIAKEAGLTLNPADAFRWLSNGGIDDMLGQFAIGGLDLAGIKQVQWRLSQGTGKAADAAVTYLIDGKTTFRLNLAGASKVMIADLRGGRIVPLPAYVRGDRTLALAGGYGVVFDVLRTASDAEKVTQRLLAVAQQGPAELTGNTYQQCLMCLEVMATNGWVTCESKRGRPALQLETPKEGRQIYTATWGPYKKDA